MTPRAVNLSAPMRALLLDARRGHQADIGDGGASALAHHERTLLSAERRGLILRWEHPLRGGRYLLTDAGFDALRRDAS